jgi:hypothetical protein
VLGWLRAAGHKPFLDHELRDGISVGEDWKQRLYRELRAADAVIGMVTSAFMESHWCSAELGIADALGCRLMPVRAQADVVHPLMPDLQYADYQADPEQARERLPQAVNLRPDRTRAAAEYHRPRDPGARRHSARRARPGRRRLVPPSDPRAAGPHRCFGAHPR